MAPCNEDQFGLKTGEVSSLDLATGWDVRRASDKSLAWRLLEEQKPLMVILSPVCRGISVAFSRNWGRLPIEQIAEAEDESLTTVFFALEVALHQIRNGRLFVLEQPDTARSWQLEALKVVAKQPGVERVRFDQCSYGLRIGNGELSRKATAC